MFHFILLFFVCLVVPLDFTNVEIRRFPYHVAYGPHCSGAIIGPKWILTAAHCSVKRYNYIKSGSKYFKRGNETRVVDNHLHPSWYEPIKVHRFDYDFQLVELAEELRFDENTQPIKVARMSDMVPGMKLAVTGWGHAQEPGHSNVLQAMSVPTTSIEKCKKMAQNIGREKSVVGSLTPRMFCAGDREGQKDVCKGGGGPAVANGRLVGVVSFGFGCESPGSYVVYSKVAAVRDWIIETTKLNLD